MTGKIFSIAFSALAIGSTFLMAYKQGHIDGYQKSELEHKRVEILMSQKSDQKISDLRNRLEILDSEKAIAQKIISDLQQEVITAASNYEPQKKINGSCDCKRLDAKWVRIHDAAANVQAVRNSSATSLVDGKAGAISHDRGTTKKRALEVVTKNYTNCALYLEQIKGLQEYISEIRKG